MQLFDAYVLDLNSLTAVSTLVPRSYTRSTLQPGLPHGSALWAVAYIEHFPGYRMVPKAMDPRLQPRPLVTGDPAKTREPL